MAISMNAYNELQVLRAKRSALADEMLDMRVLAADLPDTSKERNMLRAQYRIRRLGVEALDARITSLVKEVTCEI